MILPWNRTSAAIETSAELACVQPKRELEKSGRSFATRWPKCQRADCAFNYVDTQLLCERARRGVPSSAGDGRGHFIPPWPRMLTSTKIPPPDAITKHLSPIVMSQRLRKGRLCDRIGWTGDFSGGDAWNWRGRWRIAFLSARRIKEWWTDSGCQPNPGGHSRAGWLRGRSNEPISDAQFALKLRDRGLSEANFASRQVILSRIRENCCGSARICYRLRPMAILKKNAFSRRVPDLVTEELVAVLSRRTSFEFKQLFEILHENLRARNAASGGEEMLRLRAYEKLQNLVARGMVKKTGKKYQGFAFCIGQGAAPAQWPHSGGCCFVALEPGARIGERAMLS